MAEDFLEFQKKVQKPTIGPARIEMGVKPLGCCFNPLGGAADDDLGTRFQPFGRGPFKEEYY